MKKEIDRPIAQLILDLEERGLLDRTLVVLASEFSRDMMIEGVPGSTAKDQSRAKTDVMQELNHYGLHRHFTGVGLGADVRRRHEEGLPLRRDGRRAAAAGDRRTRSRITDLHATIFTAMGISPEDGVRRREAAVLRHRGRQGQAGEGPVRLRNGSGQGVWNR